MKVGVIGKGVWGTKIITKLAELNHQVELIERHENFYKKIKDVKVIFIITDDATHFKFLNKLKNTNKKIYCEKPLTHKKNELNKIIKFKLKNIFVSDISNYYPYFKIKNKNYICRNKIDKKSYKKSKKRYDLLYRFFYHDLGYLFKRFKKINFNNLKIICSKKYLEFEFVINKKYFHFKYNTNKKKEYTFNQKSFYQKKDNLKIMINDFLKGSYNSKSSLNKSIQISKILEKIRLKILKSKK